MVADTNLSPQESIKLIKDVQRLSYLKAIPGKWFYYLVSLMTALTFGLLSNQSIFVFVPIVLFIVIVYIQKHKTGLWPVGFAPVLSNRSGLYSYRHYWKDMQKVAIYVQIVNLISILTMLFFPFLFIKILELRDSGFWWAPIASGMIMGLAHLAILLNHRNFQLIQFSKNNNE